MRFAARMLIKKFQKDQLKHEPKKPKLWSSALATDDTEDTFTFA